MSQAVTSYSIGGHFGSFEQVLLAAVVKKYCPNSVAELTAEEIVGSGVLVSVDKGIFKVAAE